MASLSRDKKGLKRILVMLRGKREPIRLGRMPVKAAQTVKAHVEDLAYAVESNTSPNGDTAEWVAGLEDSALFAKLVSLGLVAPRPERGPKPDPVKLGPFLADYIKARTDAKPRTRIYMGQARKALERFFGEHTPLGEITSAGADLFRADLMGRLSDATARRVCGRAKQFFRHAVRAGLIPASPFADMRGCTVKANKDRQHFIPLDIAKRVLDACPDDEWQLLFALARFGGLRTPSEPLALRWVDVNWETSRITVHSPKTEHHEGKGSRIIPIYPELRPYLEAAWEAAEPGAFWVITRYRNGAVNLRTQLGRIIERAGVKQWPKLWQNQRATRQTELSKRFPAHIVCAWMGNSQAIAAEHCLQVLDSEYDAAIQGGAKSGALVAQNAAQPMTDDTCQYGQETPQALAGKGFEPELAGVGQSEPISEMPGRGLELSQDSPLPWLFASWSSRDPERRKSGPRDRRDPVFPSAAFPTTEGALDILSLQAALVTPRHGCRCGNAASGALFRPSGLGLAGPVPRGFPLPPQAAAAEAFCGDARWVGSLRAEVEALRSEVQQLSAEVGFWKSAPYVRPRATQIPPATNRRRREVKTGEPDLHTTVVPPRAHPKPPAS